MHKVIIYPGEDGYWVAECLSLPGCISQGKTKKEARANIREAIEGYEGVLEEYEANPKFIVKFMLMMKRSIEDIRADEVTTNKEAKRRFRRHKKKS
jgi:predicted RNase H-like HicB family nuclease